jgi:hypothetical protein
MQRFLLIILCVETPPGVLKALTIEGRGMAGGTCGGAGRKPAIGGAVPGIGAIPGIGGGPTSNRLLRGADPKFMTTAAA